MKVFRILFVLSLLCPCFIMWAMKKSPVSKFFERNEIFGEVKNGHENLDKLITKARTQRQACEMHIKNVPLLQGVKAKEELAKFIRAGEQLNNTFSLILTTAIQKKNPIVWEYKKVKETFGEVLRKMYFEFAKRGGELGELETKNKSRRD